VKIVKYNFQVWETWAPTQPFKPTRFSSKSNYQKKRYSSMQKTFWNLSQPITTAEFKGKGKM